MYEWYAIMTPGGCFWDILGKKKLPKVGVFLGFDWKNLVHSVRTLILSIHIIFMYLLYSEEFLTDGAL